MTIPIKQVITPPVLKLILRGHRLEKSFAGETTLAPMFHIQSGQQNRNQRHNHRQARMKTA